MKLRRSGRHTAPSQVEKVVEKAGKAAPAMAVTAGALMAVPHGHAMPPAKHSTVAEAVVTAKTGHAVPAYVHSVAEARAATVSRTYAVRSGDTLSGISSQFYGTPDDWSALYHVNQPAVSDPNLIHSGQKLNVPANRKYSVIPVG